MTPENIERLLRLTGFDYTDNLWWSAAHEDTLKFYIRCSDFFMWACADLEEVTDENLDSLIETVEEVEAIQGKWRADDAFLLWCCRQRNERPQGAYYKLLDQELWYLFDAAGPEKSTGLGNPVAR